MLAFLFPHPYVALDLAARCGFARQRTKCETVADPHLVRPFGAGARAWRNGAVGPPVEHARPGDHVARGETAAPHAHALVRPGLREKGVETEQRCRADDQRVARMEHLSLDVCRYFLGDDVAQPAEFRLVIDPADQHEHSPGKPGVELLNGFAIP